MDEIFGQIGSRYDRLVEQFGHDPRACDYGRAESQQVKFKVLSEVMPLDGASLLDVGCGFADYADFLFSRAPNCTYAGVDLSARMVAEAQKLHPKLQISQSNMLESNDAKSFDVVSANGIFYLLGDRAPELMRSLITKMFDKCRRAIAFNSLSTWASIKEADEYYADPFETAAFCKTLSPHVVLRHDYLPHDFTIYLYRDPRR